MKKRIYSFFKIITGYIVAIYGSMLFGNGVGYIISCVRFFIRNWTEIIETGWSSITHYLFFDYEYLIGLTFIIVGIYTISKGAKLVGVRVIKKI